MNTTNHNHDAALPDDPSDRLIHVALREVVGGQAPPDLSSRIIAAYSQAKPVSPVSDSHRNRTVWLSLAVAAMLLIGASLLLLPTLRNRTQTARTAVKLSSQLQNHPASADALPQTTSVAEQLDKVKLARPIAAAPKELSETSTQTDGSVNSQDHLAQEFGPPPTVQNGVAASGAGGPPGGAEFGAPTSAQIASRGQFQGGPGGRRQTLGLDFRGGPGAGPGMEPALQPSASDDLSTGAGRGGPEGLSRPRPQDGPGAPTPAAAPSSDSKEFYYKAGGAVGRGLNQKEQVLVDATSSNNTRYGFANESRKVWKDVPPRAEFAPGDRYGNMDLGIHDSSGDKYTQIVENPFIKAEGGDAVSTFSIDVDTASYANVRQFLLQMNQLPPPDAVRIEELVNYFQYNYEAPKQSDEAPFAAHVEVTACPWAPEHRLARIGIKGREMDRNKRPQSNLVFLVDVSGSMNEPAKLPLVVYGLEQLTHELGENDHIAIVVYAGTEGLVLPSTSGSKQDTILAALAKLQAGGSTAGGAGIQLAYQIAEDNFIKGGTNRVILCTDGDFNVGVTNTADLQRLVEKKAKDTGVFISTLGFGRGNLNDAMMVAISDHGNGNYHYIDNRTEARRVLVEEMTGTLVTIAKDVKIQVEFNPAQVAGYRLIGYEKRALRTEDFNDDKKDAGEIGAGHTVTALYEIVPAGKKADVGTVDDLKYQKPGGYGIGSQLARELLDSKSQSHELLTLKMRYKAPDGDTSKKLEWPVFDDGKAFAAASGDLKFAASVAGFGLMLRNSQYKGNLTYAATLELAQGGIGEDQHGYRKEFLDMVRKAKELRHE
jgi:Ca-activated chloride channel family protein